MIVYLIGVLKEVHFHEVMLKLKNEPSCVACGETRLISSDWVKTSSTLKPGHHDVHEVAPLGVAQRRQVLLREGEDFPLQEDFAESLIRNFWDFGIGKAFQSSFQVRRTTKVFIYSLDKED